MAPPWEGGKKVYIHFLNGPGHMTKIAVTPIYRKTLKNLSYRTNCHIIMKHDIKYYVLKLYEVYINDDPAMTLTYFTAMSNLAKLVFVLLVGPDIR